MFLNNLWFLIIGVLWIGYFVLEGFDFGVGALLRIVGKDEKGRRVGRQIRGVPVLGSAGVGKCSSPQILDQSSSIRLSGLSFR